MADPVNKIVDTIPTPRQSVDAIAFDSLLYVVLANDGEPGTGIHVVNPATKDVGRELYSNSYGPLAMIDFERKFEIPDTIADGLPDRRIYATVSTAVLLEITPAFRNSVVERPLYDVPTGTPDLVADPKKKVVYFADPSHYRVGIYDPDRAKTVGGIAIDGTPDAPYAVAVSRDGRYLYAAPARNSQVAIVDTTRNPPEVTYTFPRTANISNKMILTPDDKRLIFWFEMVNVLVIADLATQQKHEVPLGADPFDVVINAAGTRAYASMRNADTVKVVDLTLTPARVIDTISGFARPRGMCFSPDGHRLYVTNAGRDSSGHYAISVVAV